MNITITDSVRCKYLNQLFYLILRLRFISLLVLSLFYSSLVVANVVHLEGTVTAFDFNFQEECVHTNRFFFEVELDGCKWATKGSVKTNISKSDSVSEITFDDTNIYTYAPGSGGHTGTTGQGQGTEFRNCASITEGSIKHLSPNWAAIWWAYCSSCVLDHDRLVPGFLYDKTMFYSKQSAPLPESLKNKLLVGNLGGFLKETNALDSSPSIAKLSALGFKLSDGIVFVTDQSLMTYSSGKKYVEYIIHLDKYGVTNRTPEFVPHLDGPTDINHNSAGMYGEYISNRFLSQNELQTNGLAQRKTTTTNYVSAGAIRLLILITLIMCPLLFGTYAFLRGKPFKK
jgi:hypothetical protein